MAKGYGSDFLSKSLSGTAAARSDGQPGKSRRRPPSQKEQERRREWGKRWGKLVSEGYKRMSDGGR